MDTEVIPCDIDRSLYSHVSKILEEQSLREKENLLTQGVLSIDEIIMSTTDELLDIMMGFVGRGVENLTKPQDETRKLISEELKIRVRANRW